MRSREGYRPARGARLEKRSRVERRFDACWGRWEFGSRQDRRRWDLAGREVAMEFGVCPECNGERIDEHELREGVKVTLMVDACARVELRVKNQR